MAINPSSTKTGLFLFPVLLASLWLASPVHAQETEKSRCFNLEGLSPSLRQKSEAYLLKALDTESLFTIVGGLKPMSAGFYSQPISALQDIDELRLIVARWRCGDEIHADVVHYASAHASGRHVRGVIFSLPALKRKIEEQSGLFSRWGITPNASPTEVLMAVDDARDASRFAGYGYLFGYPDEAVHFFVNAAIRQEMGDNSRERDSRAIPTFQRETGQFTYAVPKGAEETEADRQLRERARAILEAYRSRRASYVGDGKPGVAALLRDWFCPTDNQCSPENAAR